MIEIKSYTNVPILIDKYPFNAEIRVQAIWAVRHPNKKMPSFVDALLKAFPNLLDWEFTPIVSNPDPRQLERFKGADAHEMIERLKTMRCNDGL